MFFLSIKEVSTKTVLKYSESVVIPTVCGFVLKRKNTISVLYIRSSYCKTKRSVFVISEIIQQLQDELDSFGAGAVVDNKSRMIVHDGHYIYILHKQSEQVEYTCYTPDLYYLLSCPRYCSFSYDYLKCRMAIEIMTEQPSGKRWKELLGRFIYLWKVNERPIEDFIHKMPTPSGLSVDHINSDSKNHCFWNITGLSKSKNSMKGTLAARIKHPYYCYTVIDDAGNYRVCFGYVSAWKHGQEMLILCRNVDLLISFYKSVMDLKSAPGFLRRGETPYSFWKRDKGGAAASENFMKARQYAEYLLAIPRDELLIWTDQSEIVSRRPLWVKGAKSP